MANMLIFFFLPGHPSPLSVISAVLLFSKFTQLTAEDMSPRDEQVKEALCGKEGDH